MHVHGTRCSSSSSYIYPAPQNCADAKIGGSGAFWSDKLGEWLLPYDAIREAADPEGEVLQFLKSIHRFAIEKGGWSKEDYEYEVPPPSKRKW